MNRFLRLIGVLFLALIVAFFLPSQRLHSPTTATPERLLTSSSSPNITVVPVTSQEATSSKSFVSSTTPSSKPAASSSKKSPIPPAKKPTPSPLSSVTIPSSSVSTSSLPSVETLINNISEKARAAAVNILCTTKSAGSLEPISGSGVIIDSRGVVLTNAHVGQYFLLKDYSVSDFVQCIIRTGSPAYPTYTARLLYISPRWVHDNAVNIVLNDPLGTGENDFAFLLITGRIDGSPLSDDFPSIPIRTSEEYYTTGSQILLAAYSAGFLSGISIQRNLYLTTSIAEISQSFTFKANTLDLFSMKGTIVAQKGASGGAAVGMDGKLAGLIVTATDASTTGERSLQAITMSHIERSLTEEMGMNVSDLLSGNLKAKADSFESSMAPALTQALEDVLNATYQ